MEWQSIETAPKDGTKILIYIPEDGVLMSFFRFGCWQKVAWRNDGDPEPTHWMPLPEPPQ